MVRPKNRLGRTLVDSQQPQQNTTTPAETRPEAIEVIIELVTEPDEDISTTITTPGL